MNKEKPVGRVIHLRTPVIAANKNSVSISTMPNFFGIFYFSKKK
jgi:hypothetical protein